MRSSGMYCTLSTLILMNFAVSTTSYSYVWDTSVDFMTGKKLRSPVLLELKTDNRSNHFDRRSGYCFRVYRVLYDTQLVPPEECRRYFDSEQASLGDITAFYHTLIESGRFNQSIEFPLIDQFKRFSLKASFMYLPSKGNEPAVFIEHNKAPTNKVVCVQSVKCLEQTTTPLPFVKPHTPSPTNHTLAEPNNQEKTRSLSPAGGESKKEKTFWDTLLGNTEPKSWFIATISLASLCFILQIFLLTTWLYICRIRRRFARRRCHGTCRFGCRCPPEVVRQAVNNAAVCGPLDSRSTQLFNSPLTPHGNGSIRSGSAYNITGGTMTSSRWEANNGHKLGSALYVSLSNPHNKPTNLLGSTQNCVHPPSVNPSVGTWDRLTVQYPPTMLYRRRTSQDRLCHSTSAGSSVSGHPDGSNPYAGLPIITSSVDKVDGTTASTAFAPLLLSDLRGVQRSVVDPSEETDNYMYYQTSGNCDQVNGGLVKRSSPGLMRNVSSHHGHRTLHASPHTSTHNHSVTEVNGHEKRTPCFLLPPVAIPHSTESHVTLDAYDTDSVQRTYPHIPQAEGDLVNITPPSGFYDPNGGTLDSGVGNTCFTDTNTRGNCGLPTKTIIQTLPHLNKSNHLISRPDWDRSAQNGEMVGVVESDNHVPLLSSKLGCTSNGLMSFRDPHSDVNTPSRQLYVPRIFTEPERML